MAASALSSSSQPDGTVLIHSGRRLTIEDSADFVRLIGVGLAEAQKVAVQFDPDLEADITALQVICSAHRTAIARGKEFVCYGRIPQALQDLAAAVGSERHRECNYNKGNLCPWFEGGK